MKPSKGRLLRWFGRLVQVAAVLYPASLVVVALLLRYVGEAWWVSMVGLYLPRVGFAAPLPFLALALGAMRMRRLLLLQVASVFIWLLPIMGFVMPWLHPANAQAPTMRVLSFNVNSAHSGEAQVVAEIERYDPDLVLLQETGHHATREALASLLAARYPTVQVAGQLILATRYPQVVGTTAVDGTPATPSDAPPPSTGFQRVELDTPLGHLAIYNVHTVSPRHPLFRLGGAHGLRREITSGRLFLGGGAPELHENADQRAAQVQAFAEAAARETDPVLIAGDTNLPGQSPILRRYLSAYDDAFTQSSWGFGYTFPTNKWRPWMRIDRVMARGGLRFVGFRVGEDRSASDHLCVVADVQAR